MWTCHFAHFRPYMHWWWFVSLRALFGTSAGRLIQKAFFEVKFVDPRDQGGQTLDGGGLTIWQAASGTSATAYCMDSAVKFSYIYIYIYIHTYVYIYIYTHTHTHTHTHSSSSIGTWARLLEVVFIYARQCGGENWFAETRSTGTVQSILNGSLSFQGSKLSRSFSKCRCIQAPFKHLQILHLAGSPFKASLLAPTCTWRFAAWLLRPRSCMKFLQ